MWRGLDSGQVELAVDSRSCSGGFSPGTLVFLPSEIFPGSLVSRRNEDPGHKVPVPLSRAKNN